MNAITCYSRAVPTAGVNEYKKLKKNLKMSSANYGSAIAASYFVTQGAEAGVSAALGAITSYAYISLLEDHVDNIERSPFQKQLLAPVTAGIFEMSWNHAPFAFDFDYGSTFVGFLAYKFAISSVLYETVKDMMIQDSETLYKTVDWKEQHGEVPYDDLS
jgi:hypothetical protein